MGRSTPAATDIRFLSVTEILRAGIGRATRRKEVAAAESTWDSEGGATGEGTDQRMSYGEVGSGPLAPRAH